MLFRYRNTLLLSAVVLSACGNDDVELTDGGDCVGHTCDDSKLSDPEGGQIILENMYLDSQLQAAFHLPTGVTTVNRISAFFENKRDPDANPFPMSGQCTNLATIGS